MIEREITYLECIVLEPAYWHAINDIVSNAKLYKPELIELSESELDSFLRYCWAYYGSDADCLYVNDEGWTPFEMEEMLDAMPILLSRRGIQREPDGSYDIFPFIADTVDRESLCAIVLERRRNA